MKNVIPAFPCHLCRRSFGKKCHLLSPINRIYTDEQDSDAQRHTARQVVHKAAVTEHINSEMLLDTAQLSDNLDVSVYFDV